MKKLNRVTAMLLMFIMLFTVTVTASPITDNTILSLDFEEVTFNSGVVSEYLESGEAEHGKVFHLKSDTAGSTNYSQYVNLDTKHDSELVQNKKVMLEFDVKMLLGGAMCKVLFRNQKGSDVGSVVIDAKGIISGVGNGSSYQAEVTPDEWHHVQMLIDMEENLLTTSYDGKYLGQIQTSSQESEYINNFYIGTTRIAEASYWIDNFVLKDYTGLDTDEFIDSLDDGRGDTTFDYKNTELGGIFFEKNVSFDIRIRNRQNVPRDIKYNVKLYNAETGKLYVDEDMVTNVEANGDYYQRVFAEVDRYGFYDAEISYYDENGERAAFETGQLSVAHTLPKGESNPDMGFCDHIISFSSGIKEMDRKVRLMDKIGASGYRSAISWSTYERQKGVFEMHPQWARLRELLKQYDIEHLSGVTGRSVIYDTPQEPVTQEHISLNVEYIKRLTEEIKDDGLVTYFEVGNEWNTKADEVSEEQYVNLQRQVYDGIKSVNPNQFVYGMGGVTIVANMIDWLDRCFALGAGECADGFTIHPYEFNQKPEGSNSFKVIEQTRELMEKYGVSHKSLMASEFGWPSHTVGEDNQARFSVRYAIMSTGLLDRIYWYNFQCKEAQSVSENSFGWIRQWDESAAAAYGEPYAAKPVYLAMCNYNAMLANAELTEKIDLGVEDVYAYKFRRKDGQDVIAMWNTSGDKQQLALKLGADTVTKYDFYGNAAQLSAYNGAINVTIDDSPVYVMGTFDECSLSENTVTVLTRNITVARDDYSTVMLEKQFGEDAQVELVTPDNITVIENNGFDENQAIIKVKTGKNPHQSKSVTQGTITKSAQRSDEMMYAVVKVGDSVIAHEPVYVKYEGSVTQKVKAEHYRSGRWQVEILVKNIKERSPVSGTVSLKSPEAMITGKKSASFDDLLPGNTMRMVLNVPENYEYQNADVNYSINLSTGETIDFSENIYFTGMAQAKEVPPTIDGTINPDEWNTSMPMKLGYESQAEHFESWGGREDLNGRVYLNWTKDNFYIGAEVDDNLHYSIDPNGVVWKGDCIQFAFTNTRQAGATRTEYGIGLTNGKPRFERYAFMQADENIMFVKDKQSFEDIELEVRRDGTKTYYECKIPWTQIYGVETDFSQYKEVYFSLLLNDNDIGTRRGWLEYCPGIGTAKNPELFMILPVLK